MIVPHLLYHCKTPPSVLHPALGLGAQERHRPVRLGHRNVQSRSTCVWSFSLKKRLRELGLSLEKGRLQGRFVAASQYLSFAYKKDEEIFARTCSDGIRDNALS